MSIAQRIILLSVAAALAGFLVWYTLDRSILLFLLASRYLSQSSSVSSTRLVGGIAGAIVGLFLGVADALTQDSLPKRLRSFFLFLILGVIATVAAESIAPIFPSAPEPQLAGPTFESARPQYDLAVSIWSNLSPALAWSVLWCVLGSIPGVARRSPRVALQGALGAVIGGMPGGALIHSGRQDVSPIYGLAGLAVPASLYALGLAAPVFAGAFLPYFFRRATLSIVDGPGKGREYLICRRQTSLGSAANADIVVINRPAIPVLAVLEDSGHSFCLSPTPEAVKDALDRGADPLGRSSLLDGDLVKIGDCRVRLSFDRDAVKSDARIERPRRSRSSRSSSTSRAAAVPVQVVQPDDERRGVFAASELRPAAPARLVCVSGPHSGQTFELPASQSITIGRGTDQDISIPEDTSASRAHARLVLEEGRHFVVDSGSANGTLLNGNQVTDRPRRVFPGDFIAIGQTELVYEMDSPTVVGDTHS
ncbi:MAG: FHA domain-containing protein [Capsulimonadaceae bacterium]|nr:FHA domain-containing protein [Capsulimonadaceae bacterium]